jgi:predicted RNA methylase
MTRLVPNGVLKGAFDDRIPEAAVEALVLEMAPWRRGHARDDSLFDRFLPSKHRLTFGHFWTPLSVVACVARWLDELGVDNVVDIGSGVGKFCIAGALASRCRFSGIEQRRDLVQIGRGIVDALGLEQVELLEGEFGEVRPPAATCYYFFNPFGESLLQYHLDDRVEVSASRTLRDIYAAEQLLSQAPSGGFVITYNGFGGTLPPGYELVRSSADFPCALHMSRKR